MTSYRLSHWLPQAAMVLLSAASLHAADEAETQRMTLREAILQALQNNTDIRVEDLGRAIEAEKVKVAKQDFDVKLEGSYVFQSIDTPQNAQDYVATGGGTSAPNNPAQPILGTPNIFEQRNHVGKLALSNKLSTGTEVELGTTLRVLDNSLNRQLPPSLFNPEWETFTGLTITQPLLRDLGMKGNLAEIRIAKSNAKIADYEWQARTASVVAEVMKRYYDVVFTLENIRVQKDGVALADKLLEDTRKRSKEGVAANNDVVVAEAGVYQRKEEALAAEMQYIERQNALQLLFKRSEDVLARGTRIVPVDGLNPEVPNTNRSTLMNVALDKRQEIKQAAETMNVRSAQSDMARNQSRPRLDLVASGGFHGLDGGFGDTYSRAFNGQGPEWTAGMQFSVPLNWDNLKAAKRLAKGQVNQAAVLAEKVRLQVLLEVDTVLSRVRIDQQRLVAARKSREAAQQSADAELKRLQQGVSTSYQVLQLQRDYSQARSRELATLADLNKDIADLYLTTGTLLEKHQITTEPAPQLENVKLKPTNGVVPAPVPTPVAEPAKTTVSVPAVERPKKTTATRPVADKPSFAERLGKMFRLRGSDAQ